MPDCQYCLASYGGRFNDHLKRCPKNPYIVYAAPAAAASDTADILLNPILQQDRFGVGLKSGKLYFGVVIANRKGEVVPAVYDGHLIYGVESLEAAGFNFSNLSISIPSTWNRQKLHAHTRRAQRAPTTKELIDELVALNRSYVYHGDEVAHSIIASYELLSYIYPQFRQIARILITGLPGSGKSTQTDLLGMVALNPLQTGDASKSSIFRSVESLAGLVAVDNLDNLSDEAKSDFVQLYDTSFEDNRPVMRTEDGNRKGKVPTSYRTYCPMVVNCVNEAWLKGSSRSRSIFLRMIINSNARLQQLKDMDAEKIESLKHRARLWALENHARMRAIADKLTPFQNRDADISKPLLAILKDADEGYYASALEYLEKNFRDNHCEDEYSDIEISLKSVWEVACELHNGSKEPEIAITVKDVADRNLAAKGTAQRDDRGYNNPRFAYLLHQELISAGSFLRSLPYRKVERPQNRRRYVFNFNQLAEFMEARGFKVKDDNKKYGSLS